MKVSAGPTVRAGACDRQQRAPRCRAVQGVHGSSTTLRSRGKAIGLCLRLVQNRDSATQAIAVATLRQLLTSVFERVIKEGWSMLRVTWIMAAAEERATAVVAAHAAAPALPPCARDAYLVLQDLCHLIAAEPPVFIASASPHCGATLPHCAAVGADMTRAFGLELLETSLAGCPALFFKHPDFAFLLKDRVCALLIKLFSPSLKVGHHALRLHSQHRSQVAKSTQLSFPITIRLIRVMNLLLQSYLDILLNECEIFLNFAVHFLDHDRAFWQRVAAMEVMHALVSRPALLESLCHGPDAKSGTAKVFQDMACFALHALKPDTMQIGAMRTFAASLLQLADRSDREPLSATAASKSVVLDMLDRVEAPVVRRSCTPTLARLTLVKVPESYALALAFSCFIDAVISISSLTKMPDGKGSMEGTACKLRDTCADARQRRRCEWQQR